MDLIDELGCRQKWAVPAPGWDQAASAETEVIGSYGEIIENEAHSILLKRSDGKIESSTASIGRDVAGRAWSLHGFDNVGAGPGDFGTAFADWQRITQECPFATGLVDAFIEEGVLNAVYELDGGAITLASALQASITTGGYIAPSRQEEEELVELWIAQLLWSVKFIHERNWFIGAGLLWSPQNIHLTSQNHRIQLFGLGSIQLLELARSPLPYTANEIAFQQAQDLKALLELLKAFLSGPRRWLMRSALLSPILSFLEMRASCSARDLLALPSAITLLQKLFLGSFKYDMMRMLCFLLIDDKCTWRTS